MIDPRWPDHGVPDQCLSAGEQLEAWKEELADAADTVDRERAGMDEVWSGRGAQAFGSSVGALRREADAVVAAWQRLAAAVDGYGRALGALQEDADDARRRLDLAEDELEALEPRLARAKIDALTGDSQAAWLVRTLGEQVADERREVAKQLGVLEEIGEERAALDVQTVEALLDAPGAGSQAWAAVAYQANGAPRGNDQIVADLVERLDHPAPIAADYDLLAQFLAMYGRDPQMMADFVGALGAERFAGLLNAFAPTGFGHLAVAPEVAADDLCAALATALATASRTWGAREQEEFGRALVDAVGANLPDLPGAQAAGVHAVAYLLAAPDLAPGVALGAMGRLEEVRVQDPGRFADLVGADRVAGADVFGAPPPTLAGSVFGQLARVPDRALEFFMSRPGEVTDYWFGTHDWTADRFAGPGGLLDAIVNRPAAQVGHFADPFGAAWGATVGFASRAFQALGGNLALRVGALSEDAARGIAGALGAFVGEIGAGALVVGADRDQPGPVTIVGPDGTPTSVPGLTTKYGNLGRLLGIATVDPAGMAAYGDRVAGYAARVRDHVTGPGHPPMSTARNYLDQVGGLYGFLHGSYSFQAQHAAARVSDAARAELDRIFAVIGLLPGVSTGSSVADYLAQVALFGAEKGAESVWPGIKSPEELAAIIDAGLDAGVTALAGFRDAITSGWDAITPPYTHDADAGGGLARPGDLLDTMQGHYTWVANGSTNGITSDALDVWVVGEDEPRNREDMP